MKQKNLLQLGGFIAICLFIGGLGSIATASSRTDWYEALQKPPLNPPDWVFAPVWTVLYVLMAAAGWRLWNSENSEKARLKMLWSVQLVLNGWWSVLFFGLRDPFAAFTDILILWFCLGVLLRGAWRSEKSAAFLLTPYFLWVSFATYLNAALWWLNR